MSKQNTLSNDVKEIETYYSLFPFDQVHRNEIICAMAIGYCKGMVKLVEDNDTKEFFTDMFNSLSKDLITRLAIETDLLENTLKSAKNN